MINKFIFLICFLFLFYIVIPNQVSYFRELKINRILKKIPYDDRIELEILFDKLIRQSHFGFTLFGNKPIAIGGYTTVIHPENILWNASKNPLRNYWNTWKKYEHLFPLKKYILIEECDSKSNSRVITLINRKAFIEIVNNNYSFFKDVIGNDFNPKELLINLSENGGSLFKLMNKNEALYGILLGYGKNNSQLFVRNLQLAKTCISFEYFNDEFSLFWPNPQKGFQSIEEERKFLNNKFTFDHEKQKNMLFISPVVFGGDASDPETIELRKKYAEMRKKLSEIYSKGNILEITLKQLTS